MAGIFLLSASITFGQETSPAPPTSGRSGVTIEEVVVTGSNIPTSEEVGPNPVDTYRREDITRLGVRSATDLIQKLPAATGAAINENVANGGDGRVEINLRAFHDFVWKNGNVPIALQRWEYLGTPQEND